jgi:ABC-type proline/glycine betaine transport system permease subunit
MFSLEDMDFCMKAKQKGFKILLHKNIIFYDINIRKIKYSDIYIDMSLTNSLRALSKRARAAVYAYSPNWNLKTYIKFLISNPRVLFYLGYIPTFFFLYIGFTFNYYILFIFIIYMGSYAVWQMYRRGIAIGIRALIKSIIVGLPISILITFYILKNILKNYLFNN